MFSTGARDCVSERIAHVGVEGRAMERLNALSDSRLPALIAAAAAVLAAFSVLWFASETHYRACIERTQAEYPAVAVSAFVTRDRGATGPLKVSFVRERTRALNDCGRL